MQVRKEAISGVKWTTLATVSTAICAILKISILARFLETSDFGLMALVTFVLGFMDLFMDMGLTSAILHKQNISKDEYNSLYWLNVIFSFFLFFIIALLSPLVSGFYDEPQLEKLLLLMGLGIIFSAIGRQFKTILQKELNFRAISIIEIIAVLCSLVLAIILAIKGFGVYSLVLSALLQYFLSNALFFSVGVRRKPLGFYFDFNKTRPFLKIGIYKVGGQFINYFNRDLDILIIGKFFGTELLGAYSLAKQLVKRPLAIFDQVIIKVSVSILPRFQENRRKLLSSFLRLIRSMSVANAFIYGTVAICAPLLVEIFYGEGYSHIFNFVRYFTIIFYFRSIGGVVGILAITKGRTDIEFYWNILLLCIFPPVIFLGAQIGVEMILYLMAGTQMVLNLPLWRIFYKKLLGMKFLQYVRAIFIPFLLACVIFLFYSSILGFNAGFISQIGTSIILFALLFAYALLTDSYFRRYIKSMLFGEGS